MREEIRANLSDNTVEDYARTVATVMVAINGVSDFLMKGFVYEYQRTEAKQELEHAYRLICTQFKSIKRDLFVSRYKLDKPHSPVIAHVAPKVLRNVSISDEYIFDGTGLWVYISSLVELYDQINSAKRDESNDPHNRPSARIHSVAISLYDDMDDVGKEMFDWKGTFSRLMVEMYPVLTGLPIEVHSYCVDYGQYGDENARFRYGGSFSVTFSGISASLDTIVLVMEYKGDD